MKSSIQLNSELNSDSEAHSVLSKVLINEHDKAVVGSLKAFLNDNRMVGYKVSKDRIFKVLSSSVDLGAVFLPEFDNRGNSNIDMAIEMHRARPELPIFLRREDDASLRDYPEEVQRIFAGGYVRGQYDQLKDLIDTYLFTRHYPSEFVTAIKELSLEAFNAAFKNIQITVDSPYIVKDKIIYGELFSLMPLESSWCRGYMMLQTDEKNVMDVVVAKKTSLNPVEVNFRHVNSVLGELSNMIWGKFKTLYGLTPAQESSRVRVEVPIIVNHGRKFISFGSDDPQLCFKYTLSDADTKLGPITMYQKFVFSLDWSPEKYQENEKHVDELVSSGELELF
jgi:CheY-specific phosphatase CheX